MQDVAVIVSSQPNQVAVTSVKMTPVAYREGHLACAKDLLRARAYPDLADNQGRTPLYWAVANGHPTTVRVLLQHRADPQVTTLGPDTKRKVKDDADTTVEGSGATQLANLLELRTKIVSAMRTAQWLETIRRRTI